MVPLFLATIICIGPKQRYRICFKISIYNIDTIENLYADVMPKVEPVELSISKYCWYCTRLTFCMAAHSKRIRRRSLLSISNFPTSTQTIESHRRQKTDNRRQTIDIIIWYGDMHNYKSIASIIINRICMHDTSHMQYAYYKYMYQYNRQINNQIVYSNGNDIKERIRVNFHFSLQR